jgi:hypothetical protein
LIRPPAKIDAVKNSAAEGERCSFSKLRVMRFAKTNGAMIRSRRARMREIQTSLVILPRSSAACR